MYTAATHLVEELTGVSFAEFLERRFFQPLEMTSTNLQPSRARQRGLGEFIATGYAWDRKAAKYNEVQCMDCPEAQGAGSIITCAKDYIKWIKALVNQEHPIDKFVYQGLVRQRTLRNPDAEHLPPRTSPDVYGAGLSTYYYRGYAVACHSGGVPGFGSHIFFLPEFSFGGVIFTNSLDGQGVAITLAYELIDEVLNVPAAERPDWDKSASQNGAEAEHIKGKLIRDQICPSLGHTHRMVFPLETYTGTYKNAGYHSLEVVIRQERLFINASDRSLGFTLSFEHVCEQRKYLAEMKLINELGGLTAGFIKAEFRMEKERFILGLDLEPTLGKLIWFERVAGHLSTTQLREIWQKT
jgi:hypothetical protein